MNNLMFLSRFRIKNFHHQTSLRRLNTSRAFTLVEVLVAVSVLTIIFSILVSILGTMSSAWRTSRNQMDNFAKARALLNVLHNDLRNSVIRQDLPSFTENNKNELSFFVRNFGQQKESKTARPLTYVTYAIIEVNGRKVLERADHPYDFIGDIPDWQPHDVDDTTGIKLNQPSAAIHRDVCEGILAFRYYFINEDGTTSSEFNTTGEARTKAVLVAFVVASEKASEFLREMDKTDELSRKLMSMTPSADGWKVKAKWKDYLLAPETLEEYPAQVLSSVRVYQRVTPINPGYRLPTNN